MRIASRQPSRATTACNGELLFARWAYGLSVDPSLRSHCGAATRVSCSCNHGSSALGTARLLREQGRELRRLRLVGRGGRQAELSALADGAGGEIERVGVAGEVGCDGCHALRSLPLAVHLQRQAAHLLSVQAEAVAVVVDHGACRQLDAERHAARGVDDQGVEEDVFAVRLLLVHT